MPGQHDYREALEEIVDRANAALAGGAGALDDEVIDEPDDQADGEARVCVPRSLPKRELVEAARRAIEINPVNAPAIPPEASSFGLVDDPLAIAVLTAKYWGPAPRRLTVSFMEPTPADLRARIVSHLDAWSERGGIRFVETRGVGDVRITREGRGYWSYLGTDILQIAEREATMCLQAFTMRLPEGEFRRVVRHEAGHTLGMPHEHMRRDLVARIDRERAYAYFERTQGWDRRMVDRQVLTPLDERSLLSTPADETSIMCYQLPGSITRDGRPILGGSDINRTDHAFVARIYPRHGGRGQRRMEVWDDEPEGD